MKYRPLLLTAELFLALVALPSAARTQTPELAATIRDYAKAHSFNGTVLVERQGQTVFHSSFGVANRAFNVPVSNSTKYWIASITKAFTSVLALQLYEQGKIDLRAAIRSYLPDYASEAGDRVTVHSLLNHTSGIQNLDTIKSYDEAVQNGMAVYQMLHTTGELLAKYCSGLPVREVGKAFDYNNCDYIILGKIIEKLTGKPYEQALKERILEPLRMNDSGMLYQRDVVPNLATTYFRVEDTKPRTPCMAISC